jgi:hypothetical protein
MPVEKSSCRNFLYVGSMNKANDMSTTRFVLIHHQKSNFPSPCNTNMGLNIRIANRVTAISFGSLKRDVISIS